MKKIFILALTCFAFASCSITTGLTATGNSVSSATKTGTSKAKLFLGIPLGGDASIATAAKNGNIDKIAIVDVKTSTFLGIISSIETKVIGQKP